MPERDRLQAVYSIYEEVNGQPTHSGVCSGSLIDIWTALKAPRHQPVSALFLLRQLRSVLEPVYQRRHSNERSHPKDDGYEGSKDLTPIEFLVGGSFSGGIVGVHCRDDQLHIFLRHAQPFRGTDYQACRRHQGAAGGRASAASSEAVQLRHHEGAGEDGAFVRFIDILSPDGGLWT